MEAVARRLADAVGGHTGLSGLVDTLKRVLEGKLLPNEMGVDDFVRVLSTHLPAYALDPAQRTVHEDVRAALREDGAERVLLADVLAALARRLDELRDPRRVFLELRLQALMDSVQL